MGGPWHFDNQLLCTKQISSVKEAIREDLCWGQFWIRILDLSPYKVEEEKARGLGTKMGRVLEYDGDTRKSLPSGYLRLRVEIDVSKPIRRGILTRSKDKQLWFDVRYEKLPNYCCWCGGFDHVERECMAAFDDGAKEGDKRPFADLRADNERHTFTKVANSHKWGHKGAMGTGPRFVHRHDKTRPLVVLVQKQNAGSNNLQESPSLEPTLSKLIDLSIGSKEVRWNKETVVSGNDVTRSVEKNNDEGTVGVTKALSSLLSDINSSSDIETGRDKEEVEDQIQHEDARDDLQTPGRHLPSALKPNPSMSSGESRPEAGVPVLPLSKETVDIVAGTPVKRWKRLAREKTGSSLGPENHGNKRACNNEMEVDVVESKKPRQVDAIIPANPTASPEDQDRRSQ